ncbi:MAG: ABC transporter ATP-binding protein [Chloroflexi bacterium]|nr:ABC transporter ATP-binding protein [Chloroflexota bacterium]
MTMLSPQQVARKPESLLRNKPLRKAVLSTVHPYRYSVLLLGLLITTATLIPLVVPLIYRQVIDDLVAGRSFGRIMPLVLVVALLPLATVALTYVYTHRASMLGRSIIRDLQMQMYRGLAGMPLEFFTTLRGGAAGARLTTDVSGTEPLFTRVLVSIIANLVTLVGAVVILMVIDIRLALVVLLIPLVFRPVGRTEQRINELLRSQYGTGTDVNTAAESFFSTPGMTLARQSGQVEAEITRFGAVAERLRSVSTTLAGYFARATAAFELTFGIVTGLIFVIGAWLVTKGEITLGTLVLFLLYIRLVQGPITALGGLRWEAVRTALAFDRVFEVLRATKERKDPVREASTPPVAAPADPALPQLFFKNVSFQYRRPEDIAIVSLSQSGYTQAPTGGDAPDRLILQDVSFSARNGETVAVVGASGAGKSTIAFLAAGLYRPTSGDILIGGKKQSDWTQEALARHVALITQDTFVLHDTIRANLAYVRPEAGEQEMKSACEAARLGPLLAALPKGLETIVGERGYRLSGGERQRLAVARALLKEASLIVLDEPTSQLDAETELLIKQTTKELFSSKAVLTIAHRLSTIVDAARILVLHDGRIIEEEMHKELIAKPQGRYALLYRTQVQ